MGFVQRAFLVAAAGVTAAALAGCGGSSGNLLSQSQADQLTRQLDNVRLALNDHECSTARDALYTFEDKLNQLNGVNSTLVSNLDQGASTIQDLTSTACAVPTQTTTRTRSQTTKTQTMPDTTTVTTETYPTQTYTQPTITTETYPTQSYTSTTGGTPVAPQSTTSPTVPSNGGQGLYGGGDEGNASSGTVTDPTAGGTDDTSTTSSDSTDSQGGDSQEAGGF